MAGEKWTPRFGERVICKGPASKYGSLMLQTGVVLYVSSTWCRVAFIGQHQEIIDHNCLKPAPDPAVAALAKADTLLIAARNFYDHYVDNYGGGALAMLLEGAIEDMENEFAKLAAKGGAE